MGMVLMEISVERKRALDEVGWKKADQIQETIRQRDIDPLSPEERASFKGIKSVRADNDDRRKWQF
jgi:predicted RNA-binding protein Jag